MVLTSKWGRILQEMHCGRNADKIPRHISEVNYVRMVLHCAMQWGSVAGSSIEQIHNYIVVLGTEHSYRAKLITIKPGSVRLLNQNQHFICSSKYVASIDEIVNIDLIWEVPRTYRSCWGRAPPPWRCWRWGTSTWTWGRAGGQAVYWGTSEHVHNQLEKLEAAKAAWLVFLTLLGLT